MRSLEANREEDMGRQNVRRLVMLALLLTLTLATAVTKANGQGQPTLKANVPFEFIVGDKTLPAGECAVSAIGVGKEVLAIRERRRSTMRSD